MDNSAFNRVAIPDDEQGVQPFFNEDTTPTIDAEIPKVPESTAKDLADRYHFALDENSPGRDAIYDTITSGREQRLRQEQAQTQYMRDLQSPQQSAQEFLDNKGDEPFTEKEIKYLYDLGQKSSFPDSIDPSVFFEQKYADQVLRTLTTFDDDESRPYIARSAFDAMMQPNRYFETNVIPEPDERQGMMINQDFVTRRMLYGRVAQDIIDKYEQEGYGTAFYNRAKQLIPFYNWYHTQDALTPTPLELSGGFKDQINTLYDPTKVGAREGMEILRTGLEKAYATNPSMAHDLAQKFLSYSDADQLVDTMFNVLDAVNAGEGAKALLRPAMKAATQTATIPGILDLSGQHADAAMREVVTQALGLAERQGGKAARQSLDSLFGVVPDLTNPNAILKDAQNTRFTAGEVASFGDMLKNYGVGLIKSTAIDPLNVARIPPGSEAWKAMLEVAQDTAARVYPKTNQNIVSIEPLRSANDTLSNLDRIAVNIGGPGAQPFVTITQAKQAARRYGLTEYEIVRHGEIVHDMTYGPVSDYALRVIIPVDETHTSVAKALQKHVQAETTPNTIQSQVVNFFRVSDKFLPKDINQEVKATAGGANKLTSLSRNILNKEFTSLGRKPSQELDDFLVHQQDNKVFSNTIGNFEHDWYQFHGKYPSIEQAQSYFAMKAVNAAEFVTNNLGGLGTKGREGLMQFQPALKGWKGEALPWVESRTVANIPWEHGDDAGIVMWPNQQGKSFEYFRRVFSTKAQRASVDGLVQNDGYRILNVSKYGQDALRQWASDNALKDFPKGRIDYIVVKDMKAKNLDFQQMPFQDGGHYRYRDPYFVGQPHVVNSKFPGGEISNDYLGDKNWFSARTEKEAKEMLKHAEQARKLAFEVQDLPAARLYVANNLPMSWKEFRRAFNPKFGNLDPKIALNWHPQNQTIEETHKISAGFTNFSDYGKSIHNPLSDNVLFRYGQEKGERLSGIYNIGDERNPIWRMEPSRLLDPYNAVRRATNTIMASRFTDDLKIGAASRYVQEFNSVLRKPYDELERFPVRALYDANLIDKTHTNKELVAKAQNYRRAVMEFLNDEPRDVTKGNWVKEQVLARISGFSAQETATNWLDKLMTTDPKAFLRYWAGFVPRMGVWNPRQLFMQGQGMAVTASIEGWANTAKAAGAGWYMRAAMLNGDKGVIDELTRSALKYYGWKPRHFRESMEGLQRTDFWRVGDNWADVNDIRSAGSISTMRNIADSSLVFFNKGERANKITAWNASYMKWRRENPLGVWNDASMKQVHSYADFLTMNMTRASAAANQAGGEGLKGWASLTTQFWSYQSRLMDAMLGKELSATQKLKFLAYQSMLYGVPIGVLGNTTGVFWQPSQAIRKLADYEGWDLSNPVVQGILNGIPQTLVNVATGADQNLAQTLGPAGQSVIPDIIGSSKLAPDWLKTATGAWGREDKSDLLTVLLGASGSSLKTAMDNSSPLVGVLLNHMIPGAGNPYTVHDFAGLLKTTSLTNNAQRAWFAYNVGTYFTNSGQQVLPDNSLGGTDAAMQLVFGTMPQKAADWYGDIENDKARQQLQSMAKQEAVNAYKRSMNPALSTEDALEEINTAHKWIEAGGFSVMQRPNILKEAFGPKLSEVEQLERKINLGSHESFMRWLDTANEGQHN